MNKLMVLLENIKELKKKITLSKSFDKLYNLGIDYYQKKEYETAISYFKLALQKKKIKPQVYYNLALSYQHTKLLDLAVTSYKRFLELNPNDYDGMYNLGLIYYSQQKYDKALELFEKCFSIKKDEDGIRSLTLTYIALGNLQMVQELSLAVENLPGNGEKLNYSIAKTLEDRNTSPKDFTYLDKAIEMYSKIIQKNPNHFDSYLSVSICYAKKGDWGESVKFCLLALQKNPDSYEANNQMGFVHYCRNEAAQAIEYYEKAMKLKPEGDPKVYTNLAYAYEKNSETKKAIKLFEQFLNKFPEHPALEEIRNHIKALKKG